MTASGCPRQFEAEAARDGRLAGTQLASFARHVVLCPACARAARALDRLASQLRADPPGDGLRADDLHVARERVRLLATFDHALITPGARADSRRRWPWPVVAAALAAAGLLLGWRVRAPAPIAPATLAQRVVTPPAAAIVRPEGTATWSRRTDGDRNQIVLAHGTLAIQVDHARDGRALVVLLPDGELEDTGTTFTVSADDSATTRVAVQEGSVVLRIRGRTPITIHAGETWQRREPDPAPAVSPPARHRALATRGPAPPDASADFRAAMAVLDVGAHRDAAAAFATFLARHPQDARAEDAAYLRVIALQRCHAETDMRRAASEYLRLYPGGFRRAEIEKLAR